MSRLFHCGMIIGTETTRSCRLCLVRYAEKLDTKLSIVRTPGKWGFSLQISFCDLTYFFALASKAIYSDKSDPFPE